MTDYVVTCVKGTNADLFPSVMKLYVPPDGIVLDMTWGNGVFWQNVPEGMYHVYPNDIDPERGDYHYDFRHLPDEWESSFDAVILDPPYLYTGGFKTLKASIDRGYKNKARSETGVYGVKAVDQMYHDGIQEAYRVLRRKGVLILKCQDQVMSNKQEWCHIKYMQYSIELGFENEDLFVLMQNGMPTMRHKPENQVHARRNHSYFLVQRRKS